MARTFAFATATRFEHGEDGCRNRQRHLLAMTLEQLKSFLAKAKNEE